MEKQKWTTSCSTSPQYSNEKQQVYVTTTKMKVGDDHNHQDEEDTTNDSG